VYMFHTYQLESSRRAYTIIVWPGMTPV
jgi:hypothetical protein